MDGAVSARGRSIPFGDDLGGPVAAIMALRRDVLVTRQVTGEVVRADREAECHVEPVYKGG